MGVIASVELLLDVGVEAGADGVNGLLRELQRHFRSTSCLVDYRIEAVRAAGAKTSEALKSDAYEEGFAFAGAAREVERLVAVSTAHLSEDARAWLEEGMRGAVGHSTETGGLLYVGAPPSTGDSSLIPVEAQAVIEWAKDQGITWVKFDADGLLIQSLQQFD